MAQIKKEITLNITKRTEFCKIDIPQGDAIDRVFYIKLINDNEIFVVPQYAIVSFSMSRGVNQPIYNSCGITTDGRIIFTVTPTISAIDGRYPCTFTVTDPTTGGTLSTFSSTIVVTANPDIEEMTVQTGEFTVLTDALLKVGDVVTQVEACKTATQNAITATTNANNMTTNLQTKLDSGYFKGAKGDTGNDGISPTVSINTNTSTTYKLDITSKSGTITTPNLRGVDGAGGDMFKNTYDPQGKATDVFAYMGDKTQLNTTQKDNLVVSINECFQYASDGKTKIKTAITGKDSSIVIPTNPTFTDLSTAIGQIQTSGSTSDATAIPSHILAGEIAYISTGRTTGTMTNNGAVNQALSVNGTYTIPEGYHNGSGKVTQSLTTKVATTYTPTTTDQTIASGQYLTGAQTIKGDANLLATNIISGKTIFGVTGTATGSGVTELYNFPLSIQDTQPTAVSNGHIWVKSSTLSSSITTLAIMDAVNASAINGTLMFVVGEVSLQNINVSHSKTPTSGSTAMPITLSDSSLGSSDWLVSSNTSSGINTSIYLKRPMVYSKVGGVLDIETAYMWDGTSWILISQKGAYNVYCSGTSTTVLNRTTDTLTTNSTLTNSTASWFSTSRDGTYIVAGTTIFKRIGDVYSSYFTIPAITYNTFACTIHSAVISGDGSNLFVAYRYQNTDFYYIVANFVDNGTTFTQKSTSSPIDAGTTVSANAMITTNSTGTACAMGYYKSNYYYVALFFVDGTTWTQKNIAQSYSNSYDIKFSYDNSYILWAAYDGSSYPIRKITVDYINKTFSEANITSVSYPTYAITPHPSGIFMCLQNSTCKFMSYTGSSYIISGVTPTLSSGASGSFNLVGDRLYFPSSPTVQMYYSISISGTNVTIATLSQTTSISTKYSAMFPQ